MSEELTQLRLQELLSYEPETGMFRWRKSKGRAKRGSVAGSRHGEGYVMIGIDGHDYLAHRLAWLYCHGRWPENDIDHRNQDRSDTRLCNLREATRQENARNASRLITNTSGQTGVYWFKPCGKWTAQIGVNGKCLSLGYFEVFEDAVTARKAAEAKYGYSPNHGRAL